MRRTNAQKYSKFELAREAFRVAILKDTATKALPKSFLLGTLKDPEIYSSFLKLCMEYDKSEDLKMARRGLGLVIKELGPSEVSRRSKINRVTIYRMLKADGNPSLKNLIALLKAIGMHLWMVDSAFVDVTIKEMQRKREYPDWMPLSAVKKLKGLRR